MAENKTAPAPRSRWSELHEEACRYMPAGVNSPVRAFGAVGGDPVYFRRAEGAFFEDEDGRRYVDLCCSWGPLILGHAPAPVLAAVREAAWDGLSFGAPSRRELDLARKVVGRIPSAEKVRFVNSGTEAVMTAVRVARGATGRDLIVKFEGGYHGHSDALLVKGGSGLATTGLASSAGVPAGAVKDTLVLPFDGTEALEAAFAERGGEIAAVLLEPVPANAGLLQQDHRWLERLAALCRRHGALLVLDEVITGFRLAPGGAAQRFGLEPDLVTYGKIIGGGMPVGAVAGRAELMDELAPLGGVYQAGTLSGNPVAMAAGAATLGAMDAWGGEDGDAWAALEAETRRLVRGLRRLARRQDQPVTVTWRGSLVWIVFQGRAPRRLDQVEAEGIERYGRFHRAMLERGVYLPPSGYEVCFLSLAHVGDPVDAVLEAAEEAFPAAAGRKEGSA